MPLTPQEEKILATIKIPSKNNLALPEFPPDRPHYPSTPTYKIKVPGFTHVWYKDESVNPTGTHKDRMAWEMVVTYRELLLAKRDNGKEGLPQMSIISSGSAALAIQTMLQKYQLPNLKVLVDFQINKKIKKKLAAIGCEIYETDLSKQILYTKDILKLTNNLGGIDITSDDTLGPFDIFYDWMSYEIINQNMDYVFVPYGSGHLFENIVNVAKREVAALYLHDPRFKGEVQKLKQCNFIGATTNNPETKADKLYSPHLPFVHFDINWIELAKRKDYIGKKSNVYIFQEKYLDAAIKLAHKNKITFEPSGVAGLAMLLQIKNQIPKDKNILIVGTGKAKI